LLPVFDPDGGLVAGGGWIDSPAGAYAAEKNETGKAIFGAFAVQKGSTAAVGQTEFLFKAGSFNFHSTSYDWLVISGNTAYYQGSGKINGSGDYRFLVTVTDGKHRGSDGVDTFRIQVWKKTTDNIIYDNGPNRGLGGGAIVVQAK
jgi:hypothetical protein